MRTTVTAAWWARIPLLVCTLLGLAAMHTIGHDSHPTGHSVTPPAHGAAAPAHGAAAPVNGAAAPAHAAAAPAHAAAAPAHAAEPGPHDVGPASVASRPDFLLPYAAGSAFRPVTGCPGDCGSDRLLPSGDPGGGLPGWGVCLAVLGAFAVTLLFAALLSAVVRAVGPPGRGSGGSAPSPRAPPPRPVGLRLATVSVLRR